MPENKTRRLSAEGDEDKLTEELLPNNKDFEDAEQIFSDLLVSDPHRLDHLDNYSNILYVMGLRPKLAFVAQLATSTDKFRPETCCVVGNYYSLKSEHEKAVMYFRRALTLDRTFLSAWTLMGHEFVEIKNSHAAIEPYRRAIGMQHISLPKNGRDRLLFRCQQERLQSVVRPRSSL